MKKLKIQSNKNTWQEIKTDRKAVDHCIGLIYIFVINSPHNTLTLNPFTDEQLNLFGWHCEKTSWPFQFTLYILLRMQTISRQAARRLIVLHPKQNI